VVPPYLEDLYKKTGNRIKNYQKENPLHKFFGENPLEVAGPNHYELEAAKKVGYLWGPTPSQKAAQRYDASTWGQNGRTFGGADALLGQAEAMRTTNPLAGKIVSDINYGQQLAARKVKADADTIANDAALQASRKAFELTAMPQIGNDMAQMGLGRSVDRHRVVGDAWAKAATPHIQDAVAREERRLNNMRETALGAADRRQSLANYIHGRQRDALGIKQGALGIQNQTNALRNQIADSRHKMGSQTWNQMKGTIDTAMGIGGTFRQAENDQYKAVFDDYLRRQGLSEKLLLAPFGQAGSLTGSKTVSESK
jgi:hypothetical protein